MDQHGDGLLTWIIHWPEDFCGDCGKKGRIHVANRCPNKFQQLAEQHGQPAIACHADYLPAGLAFLQPDCRWHRARHRAVQQAAEGPAFAEGFDMAQRPNPCRAVVRPI